MALKIKGIVLLALAALLCSPAGNAYAIRVAPGMFDHFALQLPEKITAGEVVVIRVLCQDSYNNLITNFSESGREFIVSVSGSATVQPAHLTPASFQGGVTNINITAKKAEKIMLYIHEVNEPTPVLMKETVVSPGKLDHFMVSAPDNVSAGSKFEIRITAKDAFDNTIHDMETKGRDLSIEPSGTSAIKASGASVYDFRNGTAVAELAAEKAGRLSINVKDLLTGSKGQSREIIVNPALAEKTQEPAKKTRETQKTAVVSSLTVKEKGTGEIKKSRTEEKNREPVKKSIKPQATASVPAPAVKETRNEKPKKPEAMQSGNLFSITDIALMETEGRGLLVIRGASSAAPAAYKYKKVIEKRLGREWLKVSIAPAVRKTDRAVKLKSEIIGEILVDDDSKEKDTVNIYIEFKAEKLFLDISGQKNALVVMISKTKF